MRARGGGRGRKEGDSPPAAFSIYDLNWAEELAGDVPFGALGGGKGGRTGGRGKGEGGEGSRGGRGKGKGKGEGCVSLG